MNVRVYLAGPEVFLSNPREIGALKRAICERHGLVGVFPADEEDDFDPASSLGQRALAISLAMERVIAFCGDAVRLRPTGEREDLGGMAIEPFELHDNLMLVGGIAASGGRLITETATPTRTLHVAGRISPGRRHTPPQRPFKRDCGG